MSVKTLVEQYVAHVVRALDDPKHAMLTRHEYSAALDTLADIIDQRISTHATRVQIEDDATPVEGDAE